MIGKKVGEHLYLHCSCFDLSVPLRDVPAKVRKRVDRAEAFTQRRIPGVSDWNVVKLHNRLDEVTFLTYPDFMRDPHPQLHRAVRVSPKSLTPVVITWYMKNGRDVPILHRKELMLPPRHVFREEFEKLTRQEENAGLFRNPSCIGRFGYWKDLLWSQRLLIRNHVLYRKGARGVRARV